MALITNDISIDDVKTVCNSGCTLPQKSTHFLIEKETLKKRITNHEYRTPKEGIFSIISFKRAEQSDIHNSSIDNRHSSFVIPRVHQLTKFRRSLIYSGSSIEATNLIALNP